MGGPERIVCIDGTYGTKRDACVHRQAACRRGWYEVEQNHTACSHTIKLLRRAIGKSTRQEEHAHTNRSHQNGASNGWRKFLVTHPCTSLGQIEDLAHHDWYDRHMGAGDGKGLRMEVASSREDDGMQTYLHDRLHASEDVVRHRKCTTCACACPECRSRFEQTGDVKEVSQELSFDRPC